MTMTAEIKDFPSEKTRQTRPNMQTAKKTLHQVILGIWIVAGLVMITGVWFVEYPLAYLAGELVGSGIATGLMFHLYHCIDVELDITADKARAHSKWNAFIRLGIEGIAVAGCCFIPTIINPITVLIGLFGRKIGALMVPVFFDKERTGQMTEEDREQFSKYGRLLTKRELQELMEEMSRPATPDLTSRSADEKPASPDGLPNGDGRERRGR